MVLYINDKGEIKDVNTTTDKTLRAVDVGNEHPFDEGTSIEKMKCYKVKLNGDSVEYYQALVDDKIIEHIDALGKENEALKRENASTQAQLDYVTMMSDIEI
jgi:hypothetical protein